MAAPQVHLRPATFSSAAGPILLGTAEIKEGFHPSSLKAIKRTQLAVV
jgi:hypothetical protein